MDIQVGNMMNNEDSFQGFPKDTFKFLKDLNENNKKEWFHAHRNDYEEYYMKPARKFVIDTGSALKKIAPAIQFEPRVNGSIRRINRDIRFSPDKTPYKDHIGIWFWEGESRKGAISGFYFHLSSKTLGMGVGAHTFEKETLKLYRERVTNPKIGNKLIKAINTVEKAGYNVHGKTYKKIPRGFEAKEPYSDLLLYKTIWASYAEKLPSSIHSPGFIDHCIDRWKKFKPLHRWLVDELG
jgi:uncharacterized protein (TIGR02453 family)